VAAQNYRIYPSNTATDDIEILTHFVGKDTVYFLNDQAKTMKNDGVNRPA
jgi:hypothetical protein